VKVSGRTEYEMLGRVIRSVREEKRLSQRDLAKRVHRPQSAIAKIELGLQGLDIIEFLDIAEALATDSDELFRRFSGAIRGRVS
jgi:transcriptional regulator with XRE-family HTH domain